MPFYLWLLQIDQFHYLGLEVINGNSLERTSGSKLSEQLGRVKRNLLVDYGEFGSHLPDVDIVIFHPQTCKVVAVLSSKVTLRERIAQTGYWKLKLASDKITEHIKVYFITPDEDGTLTKKSPVKKGRAIVETDLDGSYVLSEEKRECQISWANEIHDVCGIIRKALLMKLPAIKGINE